MADEIENVVPDDDKVVSEKPDAVVILEEPKAEPNKVAGAVTEEKPKPLSTTSGDAAEEGVKAMAENLAKAKKEAETERAARISAENRATEAEAKSTAATSKITEQQQQNIDANRTAATNAKVAAQANLDKYKKQAAELTSEGKFDEAEEARLNAMEARQQLKGADAYLERLDKAVEKLKSEGTESEKIKTSDASGGGVVDPVTKIRFTQKTYDYIKAQGDNWNDQDFRVACEAASKAANRKGIKADTDEWAQFMDDKLVALGFKDAPAAETPTEEEVPEETVIEKPKAETVQKAAPAPKKAAGGSSGPAPSRAVAGSPGVGKKSVKLTGAERDVAQSIVDSLPELFKGEIPDVLYAKNKQALIDEFGEDHLHAPTNNGA